jgi:acyl-CoA synthetase (AMP-forming)/AMP-acid ligase II
VTNTSSVRKLGFAGAAMLEGLLKQVDMAFCPDLFVNHYGSSEIYTFTVEPRAAAKPGSAGKPGLNQRIRVVCLGADSADARAAAGENGQIIADMASDEAFEGYWRRPDADARACALFRACEALIQFAHRPLPPKLAIPAKATNLLVLRFSDSRLPREYGITRCWRPLTD